MKLIKVLIVTAIFSLAASGSYFLVQKASQKSNLPAPAASGLADNLIHQQNFSGNEINLKSLTPSPVSDVNLTEQAAKNLTQSLINQNPSGPQTVNGRQMLNVPQAADIADQMLAEAAAKFDPKSLYPEISNSDLRISEDASKDSLINYVAAFNQIVKDAAQKIPQNLLQNPQNLSQDDISQLIQVYQNSVSSFYALAVPRLYLTIQKKELQLLTAKKTVFEALQNYQTDPITAILAVKELPNIDSQFQDLQKQFVDFVNNSNLNG